MILNETSALVWPGYDLDHNRRGKIAYGFIPRPFFAPIKDLLLEQARAGRVSRIVR